MDELGEARAMNDTRANDWKHYPDWMGRLQRRALIILNVVIIFFGFIIIIVYFTWHPATYRVWSREKHVVISEFSPTQVARTSALVYAYHGVASQFRYQYLAALLAAPCKDLGEKKLTSNSSRLEEIQENFIELYSIDMSVFNRPYYYQYETVNDWFTRTIRPDARPIESPSDDRIVVAPADARYMVFTDIDKDFKMWVKRDEYNLAELLNSDSLGEAFEGGSMMIARLAPADYHRFHSPVTGVLSVFDDAGSKLLSVNHDAVVSNNHVFYNKRQIAVINSPTLGLVAYVVVGATCVGSIGITKAPLPAPILHGEEIGFFEFGGSTVVMLFQRDAVVYDDDVLYNSDRHIETLVNMGRRIAYAQSSGA